MTEAERPISPEVAEAAAAWFTRRDGRAPTPEEERAFQAWRGENPEHERAWQRLNQLWAGLDAAPEAMRDSARSRVKAWRARRRTRRRVAAGGAVTVALLIGLAGAGDMAVRLEADAVTGTGERRTVALADGSVVRLNTASAIAVDYGPDERRVRLLEGEAAFEVAPAAGRPFVVEAGGGTATAKGTAYVVRRFPDSVRVTVTEHVVAVAAAGGAPVEVREGEQVSYGPAGTGRAGPADAGAATGWLRGRLVFEDRPLGEVVAEIARYHPGIMRVIDAEAARMRVSGVFPTDDPVAAVDDIERSFGLRSIRMTDRVILIRR